MGCTPSIHVNPSGVVHCRTEEDASGRSGNTNQLTGVQGNFRITCDGEEGTSQIAQQDGDYPDWQEEYVKGSVYFQSKAVVNE
ncbi:hypothetical protein X975_02341, partial [Stegodyphus mimosarum]